MDTGSGGLCRLSESVFEVDRVHHSEGRVASASVVDSLDPVANGKRGGYLSAIGIGRRTRLSMSPRRIPAWALSQHTAVRPTERTRLCARAKRASCAEVYLSLAYTDRLAELGIAPSVGSRGDSYDNALAEVMTTPSPKQSTPPTKPS